MEPFRAEVTEMNALKDQLVAKGGHPPVVEVCDSVNQRFDWLTASVDTRCDRTDACCKVATEFDEGERDGIPIHCNMYVPHITVYSIVTSLAIVVLCRLCVSN